MVTGKVIPADYFPDAIYSNQEEFQFRIYFRSILRNGSITQPAENRRTFGGGGGGGSEIGNFTNSSGRCRWRRTWCQFHGAPPNPGPGDAPPAGPPGISEIPVPHQLWVFKG